MRRYLDPRYAILGLIEGIIVALGLGAKHIFTPGEPAVGNTIINAGVITALINLITSFFTELQQERTDLLEIERKMVISQRGKLLHTALYRAAQARVLSRALSYSTSAFLGACVLLVPTYFARQAPLLGMLFPLVLLFAFGLYLGRRSAGNPIAWGAGMVFAGIMVTVVGFFFPA
jgi:predicted membrane protein (TIGR00267 family)